MLQLIASIFMYGRTPLRLKPELLDPRRALPMLESCCSMQLVPAWGFNFQIINPEDFLAGAKTGLQRYSGFATRTFCFAVFDR